MVAAEHDMPMMQEAVRTVYLGRQGWLLRQAVSSMTAFRLAVA
jgi:hypothetical protein